MAATFVERDWTQVRPGDYVQDKQGNNWRVDGRTTFGEVIVSSPTTVQTNIGRQSGPVRWWDSSPFAEDVEAFRQALGATVIFDQH